MSSTIIEIIAAVAFIVAVFFMGDHYGALGVQSKWDSYISAHQQLTIKAQTNVLKKEEKSTQITNEVSDDLESKKSAIDARYATATSVQPNTAAPASTGVSKVPATNSGHHATACSTGFSRRDKQDIFALMRLADIQAAQLVACQSWIRDQAYSAGK